MLDANAVTPVLLFLLVSGVCLVLVQAQRARQRVAEKRR